MDTMLADAEFKVLNAIWDCGGQATAKEIYEDLHESFGYTRGATYALIHRCIEKGAVRREEPGFVCTAELDREQVRAGETRRLIDKVFGGSAELLFTTLFRHERLTPEELGRIRDLVSECEG